MSDDPALAARAALFDDDFHIDDPREPSPTRAEPLLRQAIEADPGDVTSTLLLASVLARQLTTLYFHEDPHGLAWAEEIYEADDDDSDPEEAVERLWQEAILTRQAEIGRLLIPLADIDAAAASVVAAVEEAEDWREGAESSVEVAAELRAAHTRLSVPVDVSATGYDWYVCEFATMYSNTGDVAHDTWLATDAGLLRETLDRVLSRYRSSRVWHDVDGEYLRLSHFTDGKLTETIDLRPRLILTEDVPRMDWDAVTVPDLTGTPLPIGYPVEGSRPFAGAVHYGFNPGLD